MHVHMTVERNVWGLALSQGVCRTLMIYSETKTHCCRRGVSIPQKLEGCVSTANRAHSLDYDDISRDDARGLPNAILTKLTSSHPIRSLIHSFVWHFIIIFFFFFFVFQVWVISIRFVGKLDSTKEALPRITNSPVFQVLLETAAAVADGTREASPSPVWHVKRLRK